MFVGQEAEALLRRHLVMPQLACGYDLSSGVEAISLLVKNYPCRLEPLIHPCKHEPSGAAGIEHVMHHPHVLLPLLFLRVTAVMH